MSVAVATLPFHALRLQVGWAYHLVGLRIAVVNEPWSVIGTERRSALAAVVVAEVHLDLVAFQVASAVGQTVLHLKDMII